MSNKTNYSEDVHEVGERIRMARELAGLSQKELAERIGIAGNNISRYELGIREMGIQAYFKIADALQVEPQALLPRRFCDSEEGDSVNQDTEVLLSNFSELNQRQRKLLIGIGQLIFELLEKDAI